MTRPRYEHNLPARLQPERLAQQIDQRLADERFTLTPGTLPQIRGWWFHELHAWGAVHRPFPIDWDLDLGLAYTDARQDTEHVADVRLVVDTPLL
ncbi:hypothetical protein [Fodinicola feengrottensis]|uniref:Nucleotidyl transferase AbiEii/AbiGii toxin family protein n=1 Tax=Fodinicola feengrottensis TaxID=435914 RepID=A0ABN2GM08_9ACTN|nr:hypothetical protein [Fodinicola feengrottensis]